MPSLAQQEMVITDMCTMENGFITEWTALRHTEHAEATDQEWQKQTPQRRTGTNTFDTMAAKMITY